MRRLDWILAGLGVQGRSYRALVKALVLMDLRGQHYGRATGTKPGELIPPLYWVLGQYLFISAIVSGILFARVGVEAFALANLTMAMLLAATAVIVEFNEAVLDLEDMEVLGPRAISRRTYTAARLTNLGFYMVLIVVSLNLFPTILGAGLRDSGLLFVPGYAIAATVGCTGVMLLAVVIYGLAPPRRGAQDFRDLLAWSQIAVALLAFYGAQLMLRDPAHQIELFLEEPPDWIRNLPSSWLAAFLVGMVRGDWGGTLKQGGAMILGTVLLAVLALLRMTDYYQQAQGSARARHDPAPEGRGESGRGRPLIGGWIRRLWGRRGVAAPVALCFAMLRRDSDLRLRTLPALASMLAFLGIGWFLGELGDPYGAEPGKGGFSIVVVQLGVLAVPTILHNLCYSRDHAATWLFHTAPGLTRAGCAEAMRLVSCYGVMLPVMAVLWVFFTIIWRAPGHAAVHCVVGWLTTLLAGHLTIWGMENPLPLARPAARGSVTGPVLPYLAGTGALVMTVGAGEYCACRSVGLTAGIVVGLGLAAVFAGMIRGRLSGTSGSRTRTEAMHA